MRITIYNLDNGYADTAIEMGAHVCRRRDDGIDIEFTLTPDGVKNVQLDDTKLLLSRQSQTLLISDYEFGEISIV